MLKYSALGVGVWFGVTRNYTLHSHVKARDEVNKDKRFRDLVEEGKIAFDASEMAKLAVDAKKSHSTFVIWGY